MAALVALSLAWTSGLVLGRLLPGATGAAACHLAVGAFAAGVALAAAPQEALARVRGGPRAAAALAVLAAGVAGLVAGRPEPARPPPHAGLSRAVVRVERLRPGPDTRVDAVVEVLRGERLEDGRPIARGARLVARGVDLAPGTRAEVLGRVTPWVPFRNPTPHPEWPAGEPLLGALRLPDGAAPLVLERHAIAAALEAARRRVRARLRETLSPRAAAVARTLVLGEGAAVDEDDRAAVRASGLAHVFAVSGLHVTLLAGSVVAALRGALLRWSGAARSIDVARVAAAAGIPVACAYAAFAGGAPSAWRAATTAALAWGLVAAGRRPEPLPVAALAALLLGAATPKAATSPSFLLSILATLALVTAPRPILGLLEQPDPWREPWRAGWQAATRTTVATTPFVLWSFGSFPMLGVAANLVLVPLAALALLPLALAHAAAATLAPWVSPATAALLERVAAAFLAGSHAFSVDAGPVLPPPSLPQGLVLAVACAAWLAPLGARARVALLAAAALTVVGLELDLRVRERPTGVVRATFLDVGQGDAALVDLPDGRLLAVDFGGAIHGGPDPGARVLVPLLAARRRAAVDVAVATHPHPDHVGGLPAVLAAVPVRELWATRQAEVEAPGGPAAALPAQARARGARVVRPSALCGRPRRFGRATVELLAPCPRYDPGLEPNDNSLVLRLGFGRHVLLFTGDAEGPRESALLATRLRADVLKVGHHGSNTSTGAAFLAAVRPRLAVVSAGLRNGFGHPAPRVLARLARAGARVLRTDRMGGVVVETDGRRLRHRTWASPDWRVVD